MMKTLKSLEEWDKELSVLKDTLKESNPLVAMIRVISQKSVRLLKRDILIYKWSLSLTSSEGSI